MVLSDDFTSSFTDVIEDIFGRKRGRYIGKMVALVPFLIGLPIARYTLGKESTYQSFIAEYEALSTEQQKSISKKGLYYFIASLGGFGASFAMGLIFGLIPLHTGSDKQIRCIAYLIVIWLIVSWI